MAWENSPRPPRAWQAQALPVVLDALRVKRRGVVVACTGSGKSVLIAELVREQLALGLRVVVATPTRNLVRQLAETIGARVGRELVGVYYGEKKQPRRRCVVTCNPSAGALALEMKRAGLVCDVLIADEAHRTVAAGLSEAIEALAPDARVGFTATPFRTLKSESLEDFDEVLVEYGLADGLRDGVICPWRIIPWSGRSIPANEAALELLVKHGRAPAVANAVTVADAMSFAALASEAGWLAGVVHGGLDADTVASTMARLKRGELRLVVYPSMLSEGADFPWLKTLVLRRRLQGKDKSVRWTQEVGRVLRTFEGDADCGAKDEALLLDVHGLSTRFSLAGAAQLGAVEESEEEDDPLALSGDGAGEARMARVQFVEPPSPVELWAAQLRAVAEMDRIVLPRLPFIGAVDREPSKRQRDTLRALAPACFHLPPGHQQLARGLLTTSGIPTASMAGDLIELLTALRERGGPWTPSLAIWLPSSVSLFGGGGSHG
jgi:superfamily II DNA or RNA helicase